MGGKMNWDRCRYRYKSSWLDREEERQRMPDRLSLRDSDVEDYSSENFEENLSSRITTIQDH